MEEGARLNCILNGGGGSAFEFRPTCAEFSHGSHGVVNSRGIVIRICGDEFGEDKAVEPEEVLGDLPAFAHVEGTHEFENDSLGFLKRFVLGGKVSGGDGNFATLHEPQGAVVEHDNEPDGRCASDRCFSVLKVRFCVRHGLDVGGSRAVPQGRRFRNHSRTNAKTPDRSSVG